MFKRKIECTSMRIEDVLNVHSCGIGYTGMRSYQHRVTIHAQIGSFTVYIHAQCRVYIHAICKYAGSR